MENKREKEGKCLPVSVMIFSDVITKEKQEKRKIVPSKSTAMYTPYPTASFVILVSPSKKSVVTPR